MDKRMWRLPVSFAPFSVAPLHHELSSGLSLVEQTLRGAKDAWCLQLAPHSFDVAAMQSRLKCQNRLPTKSKLRRRSTSMISFSDRTGGGRSFDETALDRLEGRPKGCPTTVDGKVGLGQLKQMQSLGIDTVVLGAALLDAGDTSARAAEIVRLVHAPK
ncbi:hypothetical protein OIU34_33675 [Pararhizobium sp. BT-229]|uniref:hypothetical protein n=1 Tax=Pararhizobium sp. BT-229 TaxID=2986923 RepID=UPI0021F74B0E|nr:hypothetical protein [Pararhizobium sp. BT-229]MCV9966809.1 hypothetical protein [Pararhizobium sp. BT-229]